MVLSDRYRIDIYSAQENIDIYLYTQEKLQYQGVEICITFGPIPLTTVASNRKLCKNAGALGTIG